MLGPTLGEILLEEQEDGSFFGNSRLLYQYVIPHIVLVVKDNTAINQNIE